MNEYILLYSVSVMSVIILIRVIKKKKRQFFVQLRVGCVQIHVLLKNHGKKQAAYLTRLIRNNIGFREFFDKILLRLNSMAYFIFCF